MDLNGLGFVVIPLETTLGLWGNIILVSWSPILLFCVRRLIGLGRYRGWCGSMEYKRDGTTAFMVATIDALLGIRV